MKNQAPVVKDIVLVGGGHSHVTVLRMFGMKPLPGVRLTMVCRDVHAPYSGMLPGLVAGHYTFDDTHIDLERLCRFAGARFYRDEVVGLGPAERKVLCAARPPVPYDLLSINIGSAPNTSAVPGAAEFAVPVKPIDGFLAHWRHLESRVAQATREARPMRIVVVGGGAGGVELALCVQHRIEQGFKVAGQPAAPIEFHLVAGVHGLLPTHSPGAAARFARILRERGVQVHSGHAVSQVGRRELLLDSGEALPSDATLWVTSAGAADWIRDTGLATDEQGFIEVASTLESTSQPGVFAAGDIASVVEHPRPKSGVFAVRQGKPLYRNLRRAALGQRLEPFRPQKEFLGLVSTGDRYAVASRAGWSAEGAWLWRWKDWIDRRFMRRFSDLPEMAEAPGPEVARGLAGQDVIEEISALAMRCGGCGAKVGATVLNRAIGMLRPVDRKDVLIGLHAPDDAAVVEVPEGKVMVHTVDAFRAFVDDPYVFGRIAANHALGDIYAMGGEPQTALAIASLPFGVERKVEQTLNQMMSGAMEVLNEANCALVGGHTSEGVELSLGFAVNGLVDRAQIMRKGGMRPGDVIVLTKPVGTGTLFAADMRYAAKGRWIDAALQSMLLSNRAGAEILHRYGATACTDVTGFGLLGHLVEMTKPSEVDAMLELGAIPILDGAVEMIAAGIMSSLQPQNVRLRRAIRDIESVSRDPRFPVIFDPQTAGGLLASVPAGQAAACVAALQAVGYPRTAIIGTVEPMGAEAESITIRNAAPGGAGTAE